MNNQTSLTAQDRYHLELQEQLFYKEYVTEETRRRRIPSELQLNENVINDDSKLNRVSKFIPKLFIKRAINNSTNQLSQSQNQNIPIPVHIKTTLAQSQELQSQREEEMEDSGRSKQIKTPLIVRKGIQKRTDHRAKGKININIGFSGPPLLQQDNKDGFTTPSPLNNFSISQRLSKPIIIEVLDSEVHEDNQKYPSFQAKSAIRRTPSNQIFGQRTPYEANRILSPSPHKSQEIKRKCLKKLSSISQKQKSSSSSGMFSLQPTLPQSFKTTVHPRVPQKSASSLSGVASKTTGATVNANRIIQSEEENDEIENFSFEERLFQIAQENEARCNQEFIRQQREAAYARQDNLVQQIKNFYSTGRYKKQDLNSIQVIQQQYPQPSPLSFLEENQQLSSKIQQHQQQILAERNPQIVPQRILDLINRIDSSSSSSSSLASVSPSRSSSVRREVSGPIVIESDISVESTAPRQSHESEHFQLGRPLYSKKIHSRCLTELQHFSLDDLACISGIGKELSVLCSLNQPNKDNSNNISLIEEFSVDLAHETVSQMTGYSEFLFCVASQNFLLMFKKSLNTPSNQKKGLALINVLSNCHLLSIESYLYLPNLNAIVTAGQRTIRYWTHNPTSNEMESVWTTSTQRSSDNLLLAFDIQQQDLLFATNSHILSYGKISNLGIGQKRPHEIPICDSSTSKNSSSFKNIQLESMRVIKIKYLKRMLVTTKKIDSEGIIQIYKLPSTTAVDSHKLPSVIKTWKFSQSLCSFIVLCAEKSSSNFSQIYMLNHHLKPLRKITLLEQQFSSLGSIQDSLITSLELHSNCDNNNNKEDNHSNICIEKLSLGYENGLLQVFPVAPINH